MYSPTQVQRIRRRWCSPLFRDDVGSGPDADLASAILDIRRLIGGEAQRPPISHAPRVWRARWMRVLGRRMDKHVQRRENTIKRLDLS